MYVSEAKLYVGASFAHLVIHRLEQIYIERARFEYANLKMNTIFYVPLENITLPEWGVVNQFHASCI
jgi:hypothetical protein